jgi:hypothetical protein
MTEADHAEPVSSQAALGLARLRLAGTLPAAGLPIADMEEAAAMGGRRVALIEAEIADGQLATLAVLGWMGEEPSGSSQRPRLARRTLKPSEVKVFVAAYALVTHPDSGGVAAASAVTEFLAVCSQGRTASSANAALFRQLPQYELLDVTDGQVRLGHAVAVLDSPSRRALESAAERLWHHPGFPLPHADRAQVAVSEEREPVGEALGDELAALACVRALEAAELPLQARDWPALRDSAIRRDVEFRLRQLGRALVEVTSATRDRGIEVLGYISTWDPELRPRLDGTQFDLEVQDLAVMALAYLHGTVIPQSDGAPPPSSGMDELIGQHLGPKGHGLLDGQIDESFQRLKGLGLLDSRGRLAAHVLARLDEQQRRHLRQNLALLADPDGVAAREIRRRRRKEG